MLEVAMRVWCVYLPMVVAAWADGFAHVAMRVNTCMGYVVNVWIPKHEKNGESVSKDCYAERRGAKRDAGADERFVTNASGARARLVLGRFRFLTEVDT
jgi:hypothetical protein